MCTRKYRKMNIWHLHGYSLLHLVIHPVCSPETLNTSEWHQHRFILWFYHQWIFSTTNQSTWVTYLLEMTTYSCWWAVLYHTCVWTGPDLCYRPLISLYWVLILPTTAFHHPPWLTWLFGFRMLYCSLLWSLLILGAARLSRILNLCLDFFSKWVYPGKW